MKRLRRRLCAKPGCGREVWSDVSYCCAACMWSHEQGKEHLPVKHGAHCEDEARRAAKRLKAGKG